MAKRRVYFNVGLICQPWARQLPPTIWHFWYTTQNKSIAETHERCGDVFQVHRRQRSRSYFRWYLVVHQSWEKQSDEVPTKQFADNLNAKHEPGAYPTLIVVQQLRFSPQKWNQNVPWCKPLFTEAFVFMLPGVHWWDTKNRNLQLHHCYNSLLSYPLNSNLPLVTKWICK